MFKCVFCGGKAGCDNTKHGEDANGQYCTVRKWKCQACGNLFFTQETFWKPTEETIRQLGGKVTDRKRGPNKEHVSKTNMKVVRQPGESPLEAFTRTLMEQETETKVSLVGSRTEGADTMVQMVQKSKPINWQELQARAGYKDDGTPLIFE